MIEVGLIFTNRCLTDFESTLLNFSMELLLLYNLSLLVFDFVNLEIVAISLSSLF